MNIFALIYLGLVILGVGMVMAKDGEPRENYNIWFCLIDVGIGLTLLYFAGTFN